MTDKNATDSASADGADSREDLLKAKEKREKETGKKYKVREKMPSLQDLILEDAMREKTFAESAKFPAIVFILFVISFHLFLKFVPPSGKKHVLPQMKRRPLHPNQRAPGKTAHVIPDAASQPIKEADINAVKDSASAQANVEQAAETTSGKDEF